MKNNKVNELKNLMEVWAKMLKDGTATELEMRETGTKIRHLCDMLDDIERYEKKVA